MAAAFEVIVPWWDSGCEDRKRALDYVSTYYASRFPTRIFESDAPESRAAARNEAVASSAGHTVALIDADVFVPEYQLSFAINWARKKKRLIKPYFAIGYMSRTATLQWVTDLNHEDIAEEQFKKLSAPWPGIHGGAFVMQRSAWLEVGGMDEGFKGWGGEDNAFNEACAQQFGKIGLVKGYAFHLYHPRTEKMSDANRARLMTYTQKDKLLPPYFSRSPK